MIYEELFERLAAEFHFSFTEEQARAAAMLAEFVYTPIQRPAFILRGYAGTGKTTLIGALVKTLCELGRPVVLLAPTGRAAKVFAAHAAQEASTIHKVIYRQETFNGEQTRFNLNFNRLKDALFIVDEASMLIAITKWNVGFCSTHLRLSRHHSQRRNAERCTKMY